MYGMYVACIYIYICILILLLFIIIIIIIIVIIIHIYICICTRETEQVLELEQVRSFRPWLTGLPHNPQQYVFFSDCERSPASSHGCSGVTMGHPPSFSDMFATDIPMFLKISKQFLALSKCFPKNTFLDDPGWIVVTHFDGYFLWRLIIINDPSSIVPGP